MATSKKPKRQLIDENKLDIRWVMRSQCRVTGEMSDYRLTDQEKRWIESRPGFNGWGKDELYEVEQ